MNEIISYLAGKMADRLPSFILSRLLSAKKVAQEVRVNLRGVNPICLDLDAENPHIDLWFEITNLSNLKLTLDRLLIDVWFSQPTLKDYMLKRYEVPPREIITDIHYWQNLTNAQKQQIKSFQSNYGRIYINLTAYFDSKVGRVEVTNRIERTNV
ncbi:MAG TPA: hypothetical protein VEX70_15025 [Pyrinomonadaceae bacterium]|jgi:hypothetical protein|nr:hypothetical protein [Pyrinomonadaceae bacterium]